MLSLADAPDGAARPAGSAHLADVGEVLGEDPASLGEDQVGLVVGGQRRHEVEVRRDAADRDGPAEEAADRRLEVRRASARRRP